MSELIEILSKADIEEKVSALGRQISEEHKDGSLTLIGALKGSFVFLADLARAINVPVQIGFIGVSSYGSGSETSGRIQITKELDVNIENNDVLIVEDIVDTGLTLQFIIDYLQSFNPGMVKVCSLIDKSERRKVDVDVDYACYKIPEGFLVGYGLDYNEDYRNLPAIYHLKL